MFPYRLAETIFFFIVVILDLCVFKGVFVGDMLEATGQALFQMGSFRKYHHFFSLPLFSFFYWLECTFCWSEWLSVD